MFHKPTNEFIDNSINQNELNRYIEFLFTKEKSAINEKYIDFFKKTLLINEMNRPDFKTVKTIAEQLELCIKKTFMQKVKIACVEGCACCRV